MDKTKKTVAIRTARSGDLETIVEITEKEFRQASIDARIEDLLGGTSWIDLKRQALLNEIENNKDGCFVAEVDGKIAGYVTTTVNRLASRGTIANIAVSSSFQGMGIGKTLLKHALEQFKKTGLKQAKIETLSTNETGRHLYPSLGFKEVAMQVHYVMPL